MGNSFYVFKTNNNPGKLLFFYFAQESMRPVGLDIKLNGVENNLRITNTNQFLNIAISYLQEVCHTKTPHGRLAMQLVCLESLAGSKKVERECPYCHNPSSVYLSFNKEQIERILGKDIYERLYTKERIRHRLFHGYLIEEKEIIEIIEPMYLKILDYMRKEHSLLIKEAKGIPRTHNLYGHNKCFLELKDSRLPTIEDLENSRPKILEGTSDRFCLVNKCVTKFDLMNY